MDKLPSKEFGEICLQLLGQSQIPGSMLEMAIKFKQTAESLANGQSNIANVEKSEQK